MNGHFFKCEGGGGKIKYHWMLGVFLKYNLIKIDKFIYLRLSPMPSK